MAKAPEHIVNNDVYTAAQVLKQRIDDFEQFWVNDPPNPVAPNTPHDQIQDKLDSLDIGRDTASKKFFQDLNDIGIACNVFAIEGQQAGGLPGNTFNVGFWQNTPNHKNGHDAVIMVNKIRNCIEHYDIEKYRLDMVDPNKMSHAVAAEMSAIRDEIRELGNCFDLSVAGTVTFQDNAQAPAIGGSNQSPILNTRLASVGAGNQKHQKMAANLYADRLITSLDSATRSLAEIEGYKKTSELMKDATGNKPHRENSEKARIHTYVNPVFRYDNNMAANLLKQTLQPGPEADPGVVAIRREAAQSPVTHAGEDFSALRLSVRNFRNIRHHNVITQPGDLISADPNKLLYNVEGVSARKMARFHNKLQTATNVGTAILETDIKNIARAQHRRTTQVYDIITDKDDRINTLTAERDNLETEKTLLEEAQANLESQLAVLDEAKQLLQEENTQLLEKIGELEETANLKEEQYDNLQKKHAIVTEKQEKLTTEYRLLEEEKQQLQSTYDTLNNSHSTLTEEKESLIQEVNRITQLQDQLRTDYEALTESKTELEDTLNAVKQENAQINEEKTQLENSITTLEDDKKEITSTYELLKEDHKVLQQTNEELKNQLATLHEELKSDHNQFIEEKARIEEQHAIDMNEMKRLLAEAQEQVRVANEELLAKGETIRELSAENSTLKRSLEEVTHNVENEFASVAKALKTHGESELQEESEQVEIPGDLDILPGQLSQHPEDLPETLLHDAVELGESMCQSGMQEDMSNTTNAQLPHNESKGGDQITH